MPSTNHLVTEPADKVLLIERIFDAPRHLVFKAWTEPEHLMRWWGPREYTMTHCKADLRPGGSFSYKMRSAEGVERAMQGTFREVVEPERLVWTGAWINDQGEPGHQTTVTITLADLAGKTRLTLHQAVFESTEVRDAHNNGCSSSFDCLAEYLAAA